MSHTGLVVASFGRHCMVESLDGTRTLCHPRGKKSQVVVGDHVQWLPSTDEGTIEKVNPRRNLLYRQDEIRTKEFAANLDQVLILIAAEPEFSEHQLTRALIACEAAKIKAIIALNKSDLPEPFELAWQRLPYALRRAAAESAAVQRCGQSPFDEALGRQNHPYPGAQRQRQKHLDQPAGTGCARADQRDFTGFEFWQTHHYEYDAVLGG
jgi:putative ribosome biogenesis GTPase RsgA